MARFKYAGSCLPTARLLAIAASCCFVVVVLNHWFSACEIVAPPGPAHSNRQPQAVLMFMLSRSGSSLLTDMLNRHPAVAFLTEIANDPSSWQPDGRAQQYFLQRQTFEQEYDYQRSLFPPELMPRMPKKDFRTLQYVGFKVHAELANFNPTIPEHWQTLDRVQPRIVCLRRQNHVKAVVSSNRMETVKASCHGHNKISGENCSVVAKWHMDPNHFKNLFEARLHHTEQLVAACRYAARRYPTFYLDYEEVLGNGLAWAGDSLFRFLDLHGNDTEALLQRISDGTEPFLYEKVTSDNLRDTLENYEEVVELAKQFYAREGERRFEPDM